MSVEKGRIIGIGGVFMKVPDTEKTKQWYSDNTGMITDAYGASFRSRKVSNSHYAYLQWSVMHEDSSYFVNPEQQFMINYRVDDMEAFLSKCRSNGTKIVEEMSTYDYGKFAKIADCNGIVMELWEPVDSSFDDHHEGQTVNEE